MCYQVTAVPTGASFAASVIGFHGIIIGAGARVSPETLTKDPMLRALTAAAKETHHASDIDGDPGEGDGD